MIENAPIICGIGVILNNDAEIAEIHALHPQEFKTIEPLLLKRSKELTANIPFPEVDLLIVDEMGKNIFGTGMDTTITGKKEGLESGIQWVFVRDLTAETHGNAQGVGLADFTTMRLVDKIDYKQMYINALSAYRTDSAKVPIYFENDKEVLKTVIHLSGIKNPAHLRIAWIKNTLHLKKMLISEELFSEVEENPNLNFTSEREELVFDQEGFLTNSRIFW